MDDPFEPIAGGRKKPQLRVVSGSEHGEVLAPVPANAPPMPTRHPKLGAPTEVYIYLDAQNRTLSVVNRFDKVSKTGEKTKEFRPLTLRKIKGELVWEWKAQEQDRPLFGLDLLAASPDAPVAVVEGEKTAESARRMISSHVVVTSPGGSLAAHKTNWAALKGRHVVILGDADEAGAKYVDAVKTELVKVGAASIAMARAPADKTDGWDLADAEAEGWTAVDVQQLLERAAPIAAAARSPSRKDKDASKRPKRGPAAVVAISDEIVDEYWHAPDKVCWVTLSRGGHKENHRIGGRDFSRIVALACHERGLPPPNSSSLADALRVMEARALAHGRLKTPIRRIGAFEGCWYIDLGCDAWRVIRIGAKGWEILTEHDVPIVRSSATLALAEPEATDQGLEILRGFFNCSDEHFKLIVSWIVASLCPIGPCPILMFTSEQGSGKSTAARRVRNFIDCNVGPVRKMPKDDNDLMIAASHSWVLAIGNVSKIPPEHSDTLCNIISGIASVARAKFSDGDEFLIQTRNTVLLEGIPQLTGRPDLASRAIVVRLDPIPDVDRKTEAEQDWEWKQVEGRVLGVFLDVMAEAFRRLPDTKLPRSSRMADFEKLIAAASPALGWDEGEFSAIYRGNQAEIEGLTLDNDAIAQAILALMEDYRSGWEGTATRLLELAGTKTTESVQRGAEWPRSATALGVRIDRLKPVLRRAGLDISKRHSGDRSIVISWIPVVTP